MRQSVSQALTESLWIQSRLFALDSSTGCLMVLANIHRHLLGPPFLDPRVQMG